MRGTDLVNKKDPPNHKHNLSGLFLYALLLIFCYICLFSLAEASYIHHQYVTFMHVTNSRRAWVKSLGKPGKIPYYNLLYVL